MLTVEQWVRLLLSFCLYEDTQLTELAFVSFDKDRSGAIDRSECDWITHHLLHANKHDLDFCRTSQSELNMCVLGRYKSVAVTIADACGVDVRQG